jgi:O-antigen/teichoic acid export membrane protein
MQNFILYTACLVLSVIVQNLINAFIVDREYPYIKEKTDEKLSISEVKGIFKDCYALFIYKINTVVLNATDNIVISAFIGLAVVGEYSNYMMIYNQIKVIMIKFFNAIKASMGNLHATESVDVEYLFFKALNLLTVIGYGTAAVGIAVVGDSFIRAWIGDDYVLGSLFCLLMGVEIYILGIRQLMGAFRNTMGLFQQGKYRPLLSIILNIIISIVLVRPLGLYGVMLGTIISDSATMLWIDPLVLYRYGFKNYRPLKEYFFRNGLYLLALLGSGAIAQIACNQIKGIGWISVIAKMGVSTVVTCSIFMIISYRSEEFAYLKNTIKRLMK